MDSGGWLKIESVKDGSKIVELEDLSRERKFFRAVCIYKTSEKVSEATVGTRMREKRWGMRED